MKQEYQVQAGEPTGMYIASGILFLLPVSLLLFAWNGARRSESSLNLPQWRKYLVNAALATAAVSTLLNIVWNASWLHNGGSPHGMGAGPGIWKSLGIPLVSTLGLALALSFFGRGRVRTLLLGWSVSMYLVFQLIFVLQFD